MKLINSSFEILEQAPGIQGVKKQIELAGRTCYKSEDKITDSSCEEFVSRMVNSGHGAMLEHGTVYLMEQNEYDFSNITNPIFNRLEHYTNNPYSKCTFNNTTLYVTTNYRVLVENGWLDDLQYQCEPTEYHEKRITVKFICDRGVSHEFVRHRVFSFAQESTRYCNYSKDKFGNEITFILPCWWKDEAGNWAETEFCNTLQYAEEQYFYLLDKGWKPQEARAVLPNSLKTELVMTGFALDWLHFFQLRCHSTAHPQARELAVPLREEFIKKGFING